MDIPLNSVFFIAAFSSLFTIVNPFSAASVFITITTGDSKKKKRLMAKKAAITAALVLIIFAFIGNYILSFFGITIPAFRIAGGLIIGYIGFKMMYAKREHFHSKKEKKEAVEKEDVSIIPMAIPLLSGPGAMTTTIVLMGQASGVIDLMTLIFTIILVCIITYFVLANADKVEKKLGENGKRIVEKVMGMIVLVIGIQFIINGIEGLIVLWSALL